MRADRDIEEFHNRRLKEEEQILEAKKEQARLLKHMVKEMKKMFCFCLSSIRLLVFIESERTRI